MVSENCVVCGLPLEIGDYPCITTARPHQRGGGGINGDEIPGGMWQENGFRHPQLFYSKSARKKALAAKGLEEQASNAGPHDKIVPRMVTMDPYTMRAAEILATRNGGSKGKDAEPDPTGGLKVTWEVKEWEPA